MPLAARLRQSANVLMRNTTHEIPVMAGFCARLRKELIEAAEALELLGTFGRNAKAKSLSEALGHITREDLEHAASLMKD